MTQAPTHGQIVEIKPQPNIYTVLIIVAILVLAVTVGVVLYNLLSDVAGGQGYGLTFEQVLTGKFPQQAGQGT